MTTHRTLAPSTYDALTATVAVMTRDRVAGDQALREAHKTAQEGLAAFCLELLAVLDTLDAQVAFLASQPREAPWPRLEKNLLVSRNKLFAALTARGVSPIAIELGSVPDYRLCTAVERRAVAGATGERVAEVLRPGWTMGEGLLRAAEVAVAVGEQAP